MDAIGKIQQKDDLHRRGSVIKRARVENRKDGHSKFYEVALEEMPNGTYVIRTFWGKIGARNPGTQVKHAADSIVDALAVFHDWLIEKTSDKKGYSDSGTEPIHA